MEADSVDRALCSFCNKPRREVDWLVAGTHACICDECIEQCLTLLASLAPGWAYGMPYPLPTRRWPDRRCSFCGSSDAKKFIESSLATEAPEPRRATSVCDACVILCHEHLLAAPGSAASEAPE